MVRYSILLGICMIIYNAGFTHCVTSADVFHATSMGAFEAVLYSNAVNLTYGQAVRFDAVLLDNGNNYNPSNGAYTCSVSGTYVFHVKVLNFNAPSDIVQWHLELVKDDQPMMTVTAWKPEYVYEDKWSGSNLCVIHCAVGESIWVKVSYPQSGGVSLYGNGHSGIAGFFLHADPAVRHITSLAAFYVSLHTPIYGQSHGTPFVYDNVRWDESRAYDDVTGTYTCPISGTYVFYAAASTYESNMGPLELALAINDATVMRITARNHPGGHKMSSNACVVYCNAGDLVTVRADNTEEGFVALWGENLSSFSGFILHEHTRHTTLRGAFHATLQQDRPVHNGGKLVFDTAHYNPGADYDVNTGHYRCPATGTYVLFATITSSEVPSLISFHMYIGGTSHPTSIDVRNSYGQYLSASAMWVFQCNAGQNTWLQMYYDGYGSGILLKGDSFTTFSGFLLSTS